MNETTSAIVAENIHRLGKIESSFKTHVDKSKGDIKRLETKMEALDSRYDRMTEELHSLRMFILKVAAAIIVVLAGADGAVSLLDLTGQ